MMIVAREGFPHHKQRMFFTGQELIYDSLLLTDYNLSTNRNNNSTNNNNNNNNNNSTSTNVRLARGGRGSGEVGWVKSAR
jgi:hypothetical protein